MIKLAVDIFHCLPDELLARLDPDAPRPRRSGSEQISELLAYYHLEEQERKVREKQAELDRMVAAAQRDDDARNPRRLGS